LLAGVTVNAARALGLQSTHGRVAPGYRADFALWDISSRDEFGYWVGHNACVGTICAGLPDDRLAALLASAVSHK
jgi:imidazolonepropionase